MHLRGLHRWHLHRRGRAATRRSGRGLPRRWRRRCWCEALSRSPTDVRPVARAAGRTPAPGENPSWLPPLDVTPAPANGTAATGCRRAQDIRPGHQRAAGRPDGVAALRRARGSAAGRRRHRARRQASAPGARLLRPPGACGCSTTCGSSTAASTSRCRSASSAAPCASSSTTSTCPRCPRASGRTGATTTTAASSPSPTTWPARATTSPW